jgi:hypothetical protein
LHRLEASGVQDEIGALRLGRERVPVGGRGADEHRRQQQDGDDRLSLAFSFPAARRRRRRVAQGAVQLRRLVLLQ